MLLHWIHESSSESDDHNSSDHLYRLFVSADRNNTADSVGLFDSDSISEAVHLAFCKHYWTLQYHHMSAQHDPGELYLLEPEVEVYKCDYYFLIYNGGVQYWLYFDNHLFPFQVESNRNPWYCYGLETYSGQ